MRFKTLKPYLLVDVDGVLNSLGNNDIEHTFKIDGYIIEFPRNTRRFMKKLDELYDCIWATTWEQDAARFIAPELGVGQKWPVIRFWGGTDYPWGTTWKLPGVQSWIEDLDKEGSFRVPIAWLDDDINQDAIDWAKERGDTLLVTTDPVKGLTIKEYDELVRWAEDSPIMKNALTERLNSMQVENIVSEEESI